MSYQCAFNPFRFLRLAVVNHKVVCAKFGRMIVVNVRQISSAFENLNITHMMRGQMAKIRSTYEDHREGTLYLIFGAFTVLISLLTFKLFVEAGINSSVSNILSWACSVLFAFVVNKWFVFSCKSLEPKIVARELSSFFGARIFTGVIAFIMFPLLIQVGLGGMFMGTEDFLPKIITAAVEIVLNWIFSKYAIFTNKTP